MEVQEESQGKKTRSLKVRINNTARRRARKRKERERENVGKSNMLVAASSGTATNMNNDDEGAKNVTLQRKIEELEADKLRLHKHAVYYSACRRRGGVLKCPRFCFFIFWCRKLAQRSWVIPLAPAA